MAVSRPTTDCKGDFVDDPLDVCNVFAEFDNPVDRLLSVGNADITASNGSYYQHPANAGTPRAPGCNQITDPFPFGFPDIICDSFITIGVKCGPLDPADGTSPDADFDFGLFTNDGHIVGGWFNGNTRNGQGDAGQDPPSQNLQVLFLQVSVFGRRVCYRKHQCFRENRRRNNRVSGTGHRPLCGGTQVRRRLSGG